MYTLGIDSGSTSTNTVILDENRQIKAFSVVRTGAKSSQSADAALADVLKKAGLNREDISLIVSTGYGRVSIPFADKNVTEISCHGKGAHLLFPDVHTILDIGGQDSKAIRLNDNGEVADFVMNDKMCRRNRPLSGNDGALTGNQYRRTWPGIPAVQRKY